MGVSGNTIELAAAVSVQVRVLPRLESTCPARLLPFAGPDRAVGPTARSCGPRHLLSWRSVRYGCPMKAEVLTRRRVLIGGGIAWFGGRVFGSSISPVMGKLSAYMSEAGGRALPPDVVEQTKYHALDTLAAMISGSELAPGRMAIKFARAHGGAKVATVAGSSVVCDPIAAAFANAMLAHSDETDDSHAPSQSHPGCSIIPSALAVGEQLGIDGARGSRAVALGYDIGPRVTMTIGVAGFQSQNAPQHAQHRRGLSDRPRRRVGRRLERTADALAAGLRGAASVRVQGLAARYGSYRKGVPVRGYARAKRRHGGDIVQAGGTGVDDVLSGADNFLQVYAPSADPAKLVEKARRALRDCANEYQELDGRLAHPSAAGCAGDHAKEAIVRFRRGAKGNGARGYQRSGSGE